MANYNYKPSDQIAIQQRMSEALMNQDMRQGLSRGQKTDWGRGLAHMLRQYQGGKMMSDASQQQADNAAISSDEISKVLGAIGSNGSPPDFSNMAISQGIDPSVVQGAQSSAVPSETLQSMSLQSPEAQELRVKLLGDELSHERSMSKQDAMLSGQGINQLNNTALYGKNQMAKTIESGNQNRLTNNDKPTAVGNGVDLIRPSDPTNPLYQNNMEFNPNSGAGGGSGFGNNPIYGVDANGQITVNFPKNGELHAATVPEGTSLTGPASMNTFTDLGGSKRNLAKNSLTTSATTGTVPEYSYAVTLGPEQQLTYLADKEKIKTNAAVYLRSDAGVRAKQKAKPAMRKGLRDSKFTMDTIANNISDAREMVNGGFATTGFFGKNLADIEAGTDAHKLRMSIQPILANVAFTTLQGMRSASVNGASGLGALNEREYQALQDSWAGVSQAADKESLLRALDDILARSKGYYNSSLELYSDTYDGEEFVFDTGIDRSNKVGVDVHEAYINAEKEARYQAYLEGKSK